MLNEDFIQYTSRLGEDISAIQGSGGNTSIKFDGTMHIKASGTWLIDAQKTNIFTRVSVKSVLETIDNGEENFASIDSDKALRPSIETPLHALLPHAVVLHAHCIHAIAYSVCHDSMDRLTKKLHDFSWQFVPYARPGLPLAKAVQKVLQASKNIDVLILENHGIIVGGTNTHDAFTRLADVRKALHLLARPTPDFDQYFLAFKNDMNWIIPEDKLLHSIATDDISLSHAMQGVLYPDHIVFLGPFIPIVHEDESVSQALSRLEKIFGGQPKYLVYPKKGILVSPDNGHGHNALLHALALVCGRIKPNVKIHTLTADDVSSLMNWDAEQYRQALEFMREI